MSKPQATRELTSRLRRANVNIPANASRLGAMTRMFTVLVISLISLVFLSDHNAWADVDTRTWQHVAAASPDNYWVIESPAEGSGSATTGCDTTWTIKRNGAARAAYDYFELRWYKGAPGSDPALATVAAASVQNGNAAAVMTRDNTVSTTVCSTGFTIVKVEIFDQGYGTTANTGGCTRPGGCTSGAVNYTVKRGSGNVNTTDTSCAYGAFSQVQASWYQGHLWVSWRWIGKDTTGQAIPYFLVQYGSTPTDLQAGAAYPAPTGTLGTKQADGYYMAQQAPFPLSSNPSTVKVSFYKTTSAVSCPVTVSVITSRAIVPGAKAESDAGGASTPSDIGGGDTEACYPSGWHAFNPLEWVYKPTKCLFNWAFIPPAGTITAWQNQISGITSSGPVVTATTGTSYITSMISTTQNYNGCPSTVQDAHLPHIVPGQSGDNNVIGSISATNPVTLCAMTGASGDIAEGTTFGTNMILLEKTVITIFFLIFWFNMLTASVGSKADL